MAKIKGKDGIVKIAGTPAKVVGNLQDWALDVTAATTDGHSMGDDWTYPETTFLSWTGSATVFYDPEDEGQTALVVGAAVDLEFYPGGDASAAIYREGTALVTGANETAAKDGLVGVAFQFTGKGPLANATVGA